VSEAGVGDSSVCTVYVLRWADPDRYQWLSYDTAEAPPEITSFNGVPKGDWWEPQPVWRPYPKRERPDFWMLAGVAAIAFAPETAEELGEFLHPVGELLPVYERDTEEPFLVLNILRDVDCLNPAAYAIDDLEIFTEFIEHRLPDSGLFKIPQVDSIEIFSVERDDDEGSLSEVIEHRGYRGVHLLPVWTSDGTVQPINLLAP
jgi:hypothetical protein